MKKIAIQVNRKKPRYGGDFYINELYKIFKNNKDYETYIDSAISSQKNKYLDFFGILWDKLLKFDADLNIYNFPHIPIKLNSRKKNIIIFHHFDYLNSPFKSRVLEILGFFLLINYPKSSNIVCVSNYWVKFLRKFGFRNLSVIYNPINIKNEYLSKNKFNQEKFLYPKRKIIFYVGIIRDGKGWLKAAQIVNKYKGDIKYKLFATHPPEYKLSKNEIQKSKTNGVIVNSFKKYGELIKFLGKSNICIFNSDFNEGWNRLLVETAIYSNAIIFAKSKGGVSEVANLFKNIILYDDEEELDFIIKNIFKYDCLPYFLKKTYKNQNKLFNQTISSLSFDNFSKNWIKFISGLI